MRSHTRIKCLCTWNLSLNSGISFSCITRPRAFFLFSFTEPNKVPLASTFPTRITFIVFTMRGLEIGIPAHITTLSERWTALQSKASFTAFWIIVSESSAIWHKTGEIPHCIMSWRQTFFSGVTAITICSGRKPPIILAVFPCKVGTIIAFAPRFLASLYALCATMCPISFPGL